MQHGLCAINMIDPLTISFFSFSDGICIIWGVFCIDSIDVDEKFAFTDKKYLYGHIKQDTLFRRGLD